MNETILDPVLKSARDRKRAYLFQLDTGHIICNYDLDPKLTKSIMAWIGKNTTGKFVFASSFIAFEKEKDAFLFKLSFVNGQH